MKNRPKKSALPTAINSHWLIGKWKGNKQGNSHWKSRNRLLSLETKQQQWLNLTATGNTEGIFFEDSSEGKKRWNKINENYMIFCCALTLSLVDKNNDDRYVVMLCKESLELLLFFSYSE